MKLLLSVLTFAALSGVAVAQTTPVQAPAAASAPISPSVPTTPVFNDVPLGHWAFAAVQRLASAGIIEGYGTHDAVATRAVAQVTPSQSAKVAANTPAKAVAKKPAKISSVGAKTKTVR